MDMDLAQQNALPGKTPPPGKGGSNGPLKKGGNTPTGPRPSSKGGPSGSKSNPTPSKGGKR
jgi:hypothetical protein